MKIYRSPGAVPRRGNIRRVVAIGVFDGIHRGHREILTRTLRMARRLKAVPMAITFDCHPHRVLEGPDRQPPYLMTLEHRLRFFEKLGFTECLLIHFTRAFARTTRESFLEDVLLKRLRVVGVCVGADFRFGRRGLGDGAYLRDRSKALGFFLQPIKPLKRCGRTISSTWIRRLIETGRIDLAKQLLGRPVSVYGRVVTGHRRGRKMGFPTANLDPHHEALPKAGVYTAIGCLDSDTERCHPGVVHVGPKPTFGDRRPSFEIHLLNFRGNLYGKNIEAHLMHKIRPSRRYADAMRLKTAIERDCDRARQLLEPKTIRAFMARQNRTLS